MKSLNYKKVSIGLLAIILIMGGYIGYVWSLVPSKTFYISSGRYPGSPQWTVWRDGDNYFSKNEFGQIMYASTNASDVIQSCINDLPLSGVTWEDSEIMLLGDDYIRPDTTITIDRPVTLNIKCGIAPQTGSSTIIFKITEIRESCVLLDNIFFLKAGIIGFALEPSTGNPIERFSFIGQKGYFFADGTINGQIGILLNSTNDYISRTVISNMRGYIDRFVSTEGANSISAIKINSVSVENIENNGVSNASIYMNAACDNWAIVEPDFQFSASYPNAVAMYNNGDSLSIYKLCTGTLSTQKIYVQGASALRTEFFGGYPINMTESYYDVSLGELPIAYGKDAG